MPNIKPELRRGIQSYIHTRQGEIALVSVVGAVLFALGSAVVGYFLVFVSETLYPFSYSFIHKPLHSFLPRLVTEPRLIANLLSGWLLTLSVYFFQKNIFYRRFHLSLKALFSAVAACAFVFISSVISYLSESLGADTLSMLFLEATAEELPWLIIYYYFASLPVFALCDTIRRRIFLLP